jgi:transcriptional antiterminator NusG
MASAEEKKWYVLHTMTGSEEFVAKAIKERIDKEGMEDEIGEILVPTEKIIEVRGGEKKIITKRSYPGYVIINMSLTERNQNILKNIPKVTGFVGVEGKPVPLSEREVKRILSQIETSDKAPRPKYKYEKGEAIRIIDGPFLNFNGIIEDVDEKKQILRVTVTIFGRATPVELDFLQVEKI